MAEFCGAPDSAKKFQRSIDVINRYNTWVDFRYFFNPRYHFTNEEILSGRDLITKGVHEVKCSVKQQSYENARRALGIIMHPLQV